MQLAENKVRPQTTKKPQRVTAHERQEEEKEKKAKQQAQIMQASRELEQAQQALMAFDSTKVKTKKQLKEER